MDFEPALEPSTPRPGLPKTIGIFNILFGVILLLCGMCGLNTFLPGMTKNAGLQIERKQAQEVLDQIRSQRIDDLKNKEQATKSDEEKAKFKKERQALEAKHPKVEEEINLKKVNGDLIWLARYLWVEITTGPLLNLLLLVSGIGLVSLKDWGRKLGLWVAGLKIVRLVALSLFFVLVVLPHLMRTLDELFASELGKEVITKAIEDQNAKQQGQGAQPMPQLGPKELAQYLKSFGNAYSIIVLCLGSIYPVIVLSVLTRPGARAACAPAIAPESESQADHW